MKIAIPINDKSIESGICPSFGRAPYYLFYNTETEEQTFHENSAAVSQGGAGIRAAQFIVDQKVDALLAPRCGENAAAVIQGAGIKMYKTVSDSVTGNIETFVNNKLLLLDQIHVGFHNHGG